MRVFPALLTAACIALSAWLAFGSGPAAAQPVEVHQVLVLPDPAEKIVALTLDACGGDYDAKLINTLIEARIPATVFATAKWVDRNPDAVRVLRSHPELFDIEDHGARHVPPVIGAGRRVYGILGNTDLTGLQNEVRGGAAAIEASGSKPRWYRGATAMYDPEALAAISAMGYKVAGFSVNADAGATLKRAAIIARVQAARPGDIIIAHMNKPRSDTAEGLEVGIRQLLQRGYRFVTLGTREVQLATK